MADDDGHFPMDHSGFGEEELQVADPQVANGLTEYQQELLHQYKEILNETDDDLAKVMLASCQWDLQKAIDASCSASPTGIDTRFSPLRAQSTVAVSKDIVEVKARAEGAMEKGKRENKHEEEGDDPDYEPPEDDSFDYEPHYDDNDYLSDDKDTPTGGGGGGGGKASARGEGSSRQEQTPLIPDACDSVEEALQNFAAVFDSRYGNNGILPQFFPGSLQEAIAAAFDSPAIMERRPLALYLHDDRSVAHNIFAQQVMCSEEVSSLLKHQFILWPWDMTRSANHKKLMQWLSGISSLGDVHSSIRHYQTSKYPLLIVLIRERGRITPVQMARGHDDLGTVMDALIGGLDSYQRVKNRDAEEEQQRQERDELRASQMAEYERSLAADRARREEADRRREEQAAQEAERKQQERERMESLSELAATLPEEPAANDSEAITVRVRLPNREQRMRRFRASEQLNWLVIYVESQGYAPSDGYHIWTSDMPKKDVLSLDRSKSFAELKWPKREQVTVDQSGE